MRSTATVGIRAAATSLTPAVSTGSSQTIVLTHPEGTTTGKLSVSVTAGTAMTAQVSINGKTVGNLTVAINDEYDHGNESRATYTQAVSASLTDTVKITVLSGGPMRLDYVSAAWDKPKAAPEPQGLVLCTPVRV